MTSVLSIFGQLGQQVSQATAAAEDQATQAFYAVAGELVILIIINVLILAMLWRKNGR